LIKTEARVSKKYQKIFLVAKYFVTCALCATNNPIFKTDFYEKEGKERKEEKNSGKGKKEGKAVLKRCAASATDN